VKAVGEKVERHTRHAFVTKPLDEPYQVTKSGVESRFTITGECYRVWQDSARSQVVFETLRQATLKFISGSEQKPARSNVVNVQVTVGAFKTAKLAMWEKIDAKRSTKPPSRNRSVEDFRRIVPSPRGPIGLALGNPHHDTCVSARFDYFTFHKNAV
jgi:hypothetical protein